MNRTGVEGTSARDRASAIADNVATVWASTVDQQGRFPLEAFAALKNAHLLSILIPSELGGEGATMTEVAQVVEVLGRRCASTALIYAMHQIQVACLLRHGRSQILRDVLKDVADHQLLLGSATSEHGAISDIRSSDCALEQLDGVVQVNKNARVISYAEEADAILITARRGSEFPPGDQVLFVCRRNDLHLERTGGSEFMGLRGTRSLPYRLHGTASRAAILDDPFETILAATMLPVAHTLWSAVSLGIATRAIELASRFVQKEARKQPGTTPIGAMRIVSLSATQQKIRELVSAASRRIDECDKTATPTPDEAIFMNNVKVSASSLSVEVVSGALVVTGVAGYREDGDYAMGRLLRDAYGGLVMVNNDRVDSGTAQLLLSVRRW